MFNLPNILTASNMLCGILSILFSLSGRIDLAPFPIFVGALFDFLDGFVARLLKQQGELGKQLDSLADMITFGLAPGIMMMCLLLVSNQLSPLNSITDFNFMNELTKNSSLNYLPLVGLIIPFFSLFRLAKFNIDTRQSESFIGLPTPANTLFFCTFPLVYYYGMNDVSKQVFNPYVLTVIIVIMSLMLIAELPLFSLKFKHFKWKGNEIRFSFLITCSLLIPLTLYWSMGIIVILYLILSFVENLIKQK